MMARCRHEWGPWEMADWLLDEGIYTGYGRKCILCNLAQLQPVKPRKRQGGGRHGGERIG